MRTSTFKAVGGFDESYFMYVEDADPVSYTHLYQAVAETLDIVPTQEQIDTYSSYTDKMCIRDRYSRSPAASSWQCSRFPWYSPAH